MTRDDAEALFCERAAAAVPGTFFDARDRGAIRALCAQLGDLPLSIALAAPRVKTHLIPNLIDALRDRGVESVIDWSYGLLDARAQRLFERLSVFRGAFDADAARDICGFTPLRPGEAAAAFDELVETNLVAATDASGERFTLVEAARDYAIARLREGNEQMEIVRRHTAYYAAIEQLQAALH
jgi:non-specific serine/threonine protein kinase